MQVTFLVPCGETAKLASRINTVFPSCESKPCLWSPGFDNLTCQGATHVAQVGDTVTVFHGVPYLFLALRDFGVASISTTP